MATNIAPKLSGRLQHGVGLGLTGMGEAGAGMANVPVRRLLQSIKQIVVEGAGANAALVAAGMEIGDIIIGVQGINVQSVSPAADVVDRTATCDVTGLDTLRCTANTEGEFLTVTFWDLT